MYGTRVKALDPFKALKYVNKHVNRDPVLLSYTEYKEIFAAHIKNDKYPLYGKKKMTSRKATEAKAKKAANS